MKAADWCFHIKQEMQRHPSWIQTTHANVGAKKLSQVLILIPQKKVQQQKM